MEQGVEEGRERRSRRAARFDQVDDALLAVFVVGAGAGFGDSVGEKHEAVTGGEVECAFVKAFVGAESEESSSLIESFDSSIGVTNDRRIVSAIGVLKLACLRVEHGVEERNEFIGSAVLADEFVHAGAEFGMGRAIRRR